MDRPVAAPSLAQVREAAERIRGGALRTPLVTRALSGRELTLKLENLQPIGSFKLRGALNAIRSLTAEELKDGVYTASAGNMAQGVAFAARQAGIPATAVVPDTAPRAKLDAIRALGGEVKAVPPADWWNAMVTHGFPGVRGRFVHPFADPLVMAGNGTIALEMLEDDPAIDTLFVPWGGGGLACGIAAAARAINPAIRVYACEVQGAAPLAASLSERRPARIENARTFVDGIGGPSVFPEMWPLVDALITDSLVVGVEQVAECVRLLARHVRCVAEGAGATATAAALLHWNRIKPAPTQAACIVSGGNIDLAVLARVLDGSSSG